MKVELGPVREAILAEDGHLLVTGGPGSGKTTIALLKAQCLFATLKSGQEILFLSFSRAAARQVVLRCKEILTAAERRSVAVKTYHQEKLIAADRDPEGCVLMNIHKAKGKEFDGVVLVEGAYRSGFFDEREGPPYEPSRRLLRVGLTRARTLVTLVRPRNAMPLVD